MQQQTQKPDTQTIKTER